MNINHKVLRLMIVFNLAFFGGVNCENNNVSDPAEEVEETEEVDTTEEQLETEETSEETAEETTKIVFQFRAVVLDSEGNPIANATASLFGAGTADAISNEEGILGFNDLTPGEYNLFLVSEDGALSAHVYKIQLTEEKLDLGDITLKGTAIVKGNVTMFSGDLPLEGTNVQILGSPYSARTDIEGNFVLEKIPEGKHKLTVSRDGFSEREVMIEVTAGETIEIAPIQLSISKGPDAKAELTSTQTLEVDGVQYPLLGVKEKLKLTFDNDTTQVMLSTDSAFTGAEWQEIDETKELTFSASGVTDIYYKFAGADGLQSSVQRIEVFVDHKAPTISSFTLHGGETQTLDRRVFVEFSNTDGEGSGVLDFAVIARDREPDESTVWYPIPTTSNTRPAVFLEGDLGLKKLKLLVRDKAYNIASKNSETDINLVADSKLLDAIKMEFPFVATTGDSNSQLTVDSDSAGNALASWRVVENASGARSVWFSEYSAETKTWSSPTKLAGDERRPWFPKPVLFDDGSSVIVYSGMDGTYENTDTSRFGLYSHYRKSKLEAFTGEIPVLEASKYLVDTSLAQGPLVVDRTRKTAYVDYTFATSSENQNATDTMIAYLDMTKETPAWSRVAIDTTGYMEEGDYATGLAKMSWVYGWLGGMGPNQYYTTYDQDLRIDGDGNLLFVAQNAAEQASGWGARYNMFDDLIGVRITRSGDNMTASKPFLIHSGFEKGNIAATAVYDWYHDREFTITTVADSSGSLDGKSFYFRHIVGGSWAFEVFWIDVDDSGTAEPAFGPLNYHEITTITSDMTADQVAAQIQAAINNHTLFEATVSGNVVTTSPSGEKYIHVLGDTDPNNLTGFTFAPTSTPPPMPNGQWLGFHATSTSGNSGVTAYCVKEYGWFTGGNFPSEEFSFRSYIPGNDDPGTLSVNEGFSAKKEFTTSAESVVDCNPALAGTEFQITPGNTDGKYHAYMRGTKVFDTVTEHGIQLATIENGTITDVKKSSAGDFKPILETKGLMHPNGTFHIFVGENIVQRESTDEGKVGVGNANLVSFNSDNSLNKVLVDRILYKRSDPITPMLFRPVLWGPAENRMLSWFFEENAEKPVAETVKAGVRVERLLGPDGK